MKSYIKSGLLVGIVNIVVFLVMFPLSYIFCCPALLYPLLISISSSAAGILSINWSEDRSRNPAKSGAIAGLLAGIGGFIGITSPIIAILILGTSGVLPIDFPFLDDAFDSSRGVLIALGILTAILLGYFALVIGTSSYTAWLRNTKLTMNDARTTSLIENNPNAS